MGIIYAEYDSFRVLHDEICIRCWFYSYVLTTGIIPKDRHGNDILLAPKGFDRFEDGFFFRKRCKNAADKMRGNSKKLFWRDECIVENRIGSSALSTSV